MDNIVRVVAMDCVLAVLTVPLEKLVEEEQVVLD